MEQKKKKIVIVIVIIAVAVIAAVGIYLGTRPGEVTNYDPEFETEQELSVDNMESGVEEGIQIPGYETIEIDSGTKDVSVELLNPEENNVYFEISFYLSETDEVIYKSKLIKPGQHLYEITLERELEAGEYPLTIRYDTYSADENLTPRNGAEVNCTLIVRE